MSACHDAINIKVNLGIYMQILNGYIQMCFFSNWDTRLAELLNISNHNLATLEHVQCHTELINFESGQGPNVFDTKDLQDNITSTTDSALYWFELCYNIYL